jgi:hypothetical protein
MFENIKVGDKLYLHDTYARRNEKPFKVLTVNKIGKKYIFCGDYGTYSDYNRYKININTGEEVSENGGCKFVYNSVEEIKNNVILTKMTIFADEWMRKINDEDKYKIYLQFKDIIDEYINIDEINEKYSL